VQVSFNVSSTTLPFVKSGKVRALAVTSKTRSEFLPELPTVAETVPGYENLTWNGVGAPARTPSAVIARLNHELGAILKTPEMTEAARVQAYTLVGGTPAQFAEHLRAEHAKFSKLLKEAGIKRAE